MDNENTFFQPDEPSWAMEAACDLIDDVIGTHETETPEAWIHLYQAKAIVDAAICAHDSQGRDVELFHVFGAVAALIDKGCEGLERIKRPRLRAKKPVLHVVPAIEEARP
jgi:hypothetical protein